MTVTLNLRPETQAGLEELAHAAGKHGLEERAAAWIGSAGPDRSQAIRDLSRAEAREGLYGRSPAGIVP
jgi:hypothetical protein